MKRQKKNFGAEFGQKIEENLEEGLEEAIEGRRLHLGASRPTDNWTSRTQVKKSKSYTTLQSSSFMH